ncbi:MAG: hypothetical protein JNK15_01720 [Planctomycetes bacterium]|nr:hypothetical protein [Planctomycetota bacterium]
MLALRFAAAVSLLAAFGSAQHTTPNSASSPTYFLSAIDFGSGEDADTLLYRLRGEQGAGVVTEPDAASATYRMRGGFLGALTAPVTGQPWLTAARPFFLKPAGNGNLTLHGTELWLGPTPTITIGGQTAPVIARTVDQMLVSVPNQPVPGFQPVVFSNTAGSTVLPEGVGVLPMVEKREPLDGASPNYLRIHTMPFDVVLLILAESQGPGFQVLDFHYQLLLNPATVIFTDAFFVADPDGKTTIPIPPFPTGLVHVQALAVTADPSYYPASFTNPVAL